MRQILFFVFILFTSNSFSQKQNISFEHINIEQGLSQSTVATILQDSRGFMWFGTRDGLNKYDGYKFTVYKEDIEHKQNISNSNVFDLLEDKEGNIWIATWGGGINVYDRFKDTFRSFRHNENNPNSLSNDAVHCLALDGDDLWIGTNVGLNKLNIKTGIFKRYYTNPEDSFSISDNKMEAIIKDSEGNIWIGTMNGLNLYNKQTDNFKRFTHHPNVTGSISSNRIFSLFEDSKKNLWVGTYGGGVNLFDKRKGTFRVYQHDPNDIKSLSHNVIKSIKEDDYGNIWIGTENGGLNILNTKTGKFARLTHDEKDYSSLRNNSIYSICKDQKGNMWVGTYSGGVSFFNRDSDKFYHYKNSSSLNSLNNNTITAIHEDSKGNIWIGTDGGGLNLFDEKNGTFYAYMHQRGNKNSICGNYLLSVFEDSNGDLWVGTYGSGLTVFNKEKNTFKHYKHDPDVNGTLSSNNAWSIIEDKDKNIWIGSFGGGLDLYNRETDTFINFRHKPENSSGLSENFIHTLYEDRKGNIIIGHNAGGIDIYDKKIGSFTNLKPDDKSPNSLSNSTINCFYEDEFENLWVGTQSGLNYWDRKKNTFTVYKIKDGLPSDKIWGILSDDNNNLWISTNNGISRFNLSNKTFTNYDVEDGLQGNEFLKGFYKTKSGHMYFGGIHGFNVFHPDSIKENHIYEANLLITDFEILNSKVPIQRINVKDSPLKVHINETEDVTLSYTNSVISFEFASLNYVNTRKKKYAYTLKGFDEVWHEIGAKNSITYTNLDPGKYVLQIKGINNQGNWSNNIRQLNITITPPFWKTWWFKALVVIFSFGSITGLFYIRMSIVKRQKRVLEEQVKARTSDLLKANNELTEQKEEIDEQKVKIEELYTDIKDSIRAAEVIQNAILPADENIGRHFSDFFILNKPKDIVSGDFYWFEEKDNKILIAAVDCTGHGVSGAFMSIHGHHLLNQAVQSCPSCNPSEILDKLNASIIKELHLQSGQTKNYNGMDIALCIIDRDTRELNFSGANCPLYIIRNKEVIQVKPEKFSLGLSINGQVRHFNNNKVQLIPGDICYLFSDGYADQIGGTDNEKFMYFRFRDLLLSFADEKLNKQKQILEEVFDDWKGTNKQLDDILVIGFKFP